MEIINSLLPFLVIASIPFGMKNGDFSAVSDGKAAAWEPVKHYKALRTGGYKGRPAVLLECTGDGDSSGVMQSLKFDKPRRGAFKVSAWVKGEGVGAGGDFSLWLDVLQAGGKPLWGRQGIPDRQKTGWQHVTVEVVPDKPVSEIQIWLLLRNVKGKAWFSDVTIEEIPLRIKSFRVVPDGGKSFEVRASMGDRVPWTLKAVQQRKEVWSLSGEGRWISGRFNVPEDRPVEVTLTADPEGAAKSSVITVKPDSDPKPLDWWIADSMTRVFQDDLPPEKPIQSIQVDAAINDRESFQICLRPRLQKLDNVTIRISNLLNENRSSTNSVSSAVHKSALEWFRVGYVLVKEPYAHPHSPRDTEAWWPDPLLPAADFSVEAGIAQPLWFTLHVPKNAEPGTYKGEITISADHLKPVKIPVSVNVYPASIPDQGYMKTAFALMDCYLKRIYGKITLELRRAYTDFLLAHHLNPDDISRSHFPDLNELEYANKHGLNAFNVLNVVEEPEKETSWTCWSPVEAYTPEFKESFFKKLDSFIPELEKRGLIDKGYIYGFDERGPEYMPIIRDIFGEIKKRYPKIHTLSTCWPPAGTDPLSLNIDWFVPLSSSYDPQTAQKVRERGGEMWWYICLGPNYPYANWLLENPLIEARLIWWQAFQYDVEGFLYWGLNIWERENNDKPIPRDCGPRIPWSVTTGGDWTSLNGDGVLLYPGADGPVGSIRLENIRDGLEDIELLRQYKQKLGEKAVREIVKAVITDRTRYSREQNDLLKARRDVLKEWLLADG